MMESVGVSLLTEWAIGGAGSIDVVRSLAKRSRLQSLLARQGPPSTCGPEDEPRRVQPLDRKL
jgi:hypothetical protein